jgi:hypothetical protein
MGTTRIGVRQTHQMGLEQANPKEGEKQSTPLNAKQKKCARINKIEED